MECRCSSVGTQFSPESVYHKWWDKYNDNSNCLGNVNNETSGSGLESYCSQQWIYLKVCNTLLLMSPFSFMGLNHYFCSLLDFFSCIFIFPLLRVLVLNIWVPLNGLQQILFLPGRVVYGIAAISQNYLQVMFHLIIWKHVGNHMSLVSTSGLTFLVPSISGIPLKYFINYCDKIVFHVT